ncbi:MAG: hypothetical protein Q7T87_04315 [Polaromonas sp.]|nr:hypothetical protein [Polaromonas sp.]
MQTFGFGGANTWPSGTTSRSFAVGSGPTALTIGFVLTPSSAYVVPYPMLDTLSTTPNSLEIDHDGTAAGALLSTLAISFSRPVSKLRLVAMDIDSVVDGSNRFQDQIVVAASLGGAAVTPSLTAVNPSRVTISGGTATAVINSGNCTTAQTACNVTIDVVQPVTAVTVNIRSGPNTGNNTSLQATAYNSFGFCVPVSATALLALTKSNGSNAVTAGSTTTYTLTASNAGPGAADGAIIRDPPASGLACTQLTCASAGGAACPATPGVAGLQAGLVIPSFPAQSTISLQLTCQVTATGQ